MRRGIVRLEAVDKDYGEDDAIVRVLQGIDFEVTEGEMVGIVGASGSGKSTLLNILGCLDRPSRGKYMLLDQDVSTLGDTELSSLRNGTIGFVFQSFNLIPQLTVLENVETPGFYGRVPRREREKKSRDLLHQVGLSHRTGHYPPQLSGGEKQRVAIARALANDPAFLLADEPTGNLDSKSGQDILRLVFELWERGRTILMVTHNPEIASALPRVIELKDGRIDRDGKPAFALAERASAPAREGS
jgi:ABC-type lipoprotein export system ATPase subunit